MGRISARQIVRIGDRGQSRVQGVLGKIRQALSKPFGPDRVLVLRPTGELDLIDDVKNATGIHQKFWVNRGCPVPKDDDPKTFDWIFDWVAKMIHLSEWEFICHEAQRPLSRTASTPQEVAEVWALDGIDGVEVDGNLCQIRLVRSGAP